MALVLLYTDCRPGIGTTYRADESYWDTVAKAVIPRSTPTNVCDDYSADTADVIDRYCINPGVSPFTERVVYHDGGGDVTFVDTDGVTACSLTPGGCTLAVTVPYVASEGVNSLGSAVVNVTGNVGAFELSLDAFQSDVRTSPTIYDLPAGEYEVTVREVRGEGCTASARFVVGSPYGKRFTLPFLERDGTACKVDIYLRGYTGSVETLDGDGPNAVVISWPGDAADHFFAARLRGSECELHISCNTRGQLADLYGADERQARVIVSRNNAEIWRGYLLPDQWQEPILAPPFVSTIRATDGLGALKDKPFAYENGLPLRPQLLSHLDTIRHCIALAGHRNALGFATVGDLWSERMAPGRFLNYLSEVGTWTHGWVDDKGAPWAAGDVLAALLAYYQLRLYQWAGQWRIERLSDLSRPLNRQFILDATGGTTDVLDDYRPEARIYPFDTADTSQLHWVHTEQTLALVPSVARVELSGVQENSAINLLPEAAEWAPTYFASTGVLWRWRGDAVYSRVPAPNDAKGITLKLDATNSSDYIARRLTLFERDTPWRYGVGDFDYWPALRLVVDVETTGLHGGDFGDPAYPLVFEFYVNGVKSSDDDVAAISFLLGARRKVGINVPLDWIGRADPVTLPVALEIRIKPRPLAGGDVYFHSIALTYGFASNIIGEFSEPDGVLEPLPVGTYIASTNIAHATRVDREDLEMTEANTVDPVPGDISANTPTVFQRGTQLIGGGAVRRWFESASDVDPLIGLPPYTAFGGSGMGDLNARDRALWQRQPAKVLTGTISGLLADGPGSLLADAAAGPNLFVQTDTRYDVALREWHVRAVEMLTALATPPEEPTDTSSHLLTEPGGYLLTEAAEHLIQE